MDAIFYVLFVGLTVPADRAWRIRATMSKRYMKDRLLSERRIKLEVDGGYGDVETDYRTLCVHRGPPRMSESCESVEEKRSSSASPGPIPPLISVPRRNAHLSGGSAVPRPEERALHSSLTLKQLNEAQVQVTYLMTKELIHKTDSFGRTYLHNAVANNLGAVVYKLVEKFRKQPDKWININVQDHAKCTPLHYACMVGSPNPLLVGYFCEAGASVNMVNEDGATPLYLAAERGYTEVVDKLLKVPCIDVNMSNRMRRTPLHAAVMSHNRKMVNQGDPSKYTHIDSKDVIKKLLLNEASMSEQDIVGETVFHYAVQTQKFDLLEVFISFGNINALAKRNRHGDTALHMACNLQPAKCSEATQEKFVKYLVTSSAPTDIVNDAGKLPRDLVPRDRPHVLRWLPAKSQSP